MTATQAPTPGPLNVTIGQVDLDRLRSIIHLATHQVLPFADKPMKPFSAKERAGMQVEIADLIINDIGKANAPTAPVEASGSERDDPDFWCRLMGEALDALDIIASDEPWSDGATSAVFAEKASATIRAKYSDLSLEPHDERRGGYDRSDVRYGLQLIADEECDEVAAAYYAKKALAALRPQPSGETREERLSAALIAIVEHFERVDAAPEDKAAIQAACEVWAGVKRDKALATTPARAEAQDEGAAGEIERLMTLAAEANDDGELDQAMRLVQQADALYAHPSPPPAADEDGVRIMREALEWALDQAGAEHPHYPERSDTGGWHFPYLVHGSPMGGGVGHARYDTALEAVQAARTWPASGPDAPAGQMTLALKSTAAKEGGEV